MRKISFNFLFIIGLTLTLGITSAFGFNDDKNKRPKNTGILTVKTSPVSYPVKVDGAFIGMSGTSAATEFYLAPGVHKLEIEFPNGKVYTKEIEIFRDRKNCVCLRYVEETIKRPCPYDVSVSAPDNVLEGDLITFAAFNNVSGSTTPLNYRWTVSPDTVRVTSGLGTSAITVDTTGMGGQTITAELDVTDDVYGKTCMQKNSVPTEVKQKPKIESFRCDEFESVSRDEDKARFDNCVLQLQGSPDSQMYIIIYQGTDKISMTRNTYDALSKRTLDYLVKTRGVDPRRISIVKGSTNRVKTTYEVWFVPPGAPLPVPQ
jgi:hypothetical protein